MSHHYEFAHDKGFSLSRIWGMGSMGELEGFLGIAYQGKKDIVFRFIIEYSSLRDFGP
jgi:hypothetical protein